MNSLNQIILEGNVCRQPELRQSAAGNYVCVMPIAVNRSYRSAKGENTEEVSFFDVATFGKTAEVCSRYATIGRHVRVVGRLKQDRWKNQEGKAQSKVNIIAEHVELLNLPRRQMDGPLTDGASKAGRSNAGSSCHAGGDSGAEATLVATNEAAASQRDEEEDVVGEEIPAF